MHDHTTGVRTRSARWLIAVTLVSAGSASTGLAASATVNAEGTGDYETLQAAMFALAPGDTLWLEDGTYLGALNRNLNFYGKPLVVRSVSDDPERCVIDCENAGRGVGVFSGEPDGTLIRGLTFRNGYASEEGGGIRLDEGSHLSLENCVIADCWAPRGGGIAINYRSSVSMVNVAVLGNESDAGGGAFLFGDSSLNVIGSTIAGNVASAFGGGGIWCGDRSDLDVETSTISNNHAKGYGTGIFAHAYATVSIADSIVWENCGADERAADIYTWDDTTELSIGCTIVDPDRIGGRADVVETGNLIASDPLFCLESVCVAGGVTGAADLDVASNSPALPPNNPCSRLLGARSDACAAQVPVIARSWGAIKGAYHRD